MVIVVEMTISVHYIENVWYLMCTLVTTLSDHSFHHAAIHVFMDSQRIQIYTKPSDLFRECTSGVMFIADLHCSNLSAVVSRIWRYVKSFFQ